MQCAVCGSTTNLVRLACGGGNHYLCIACNNQWYNTPIKDGAGQDVRGTHSTKCPMCRTEGSVQLQMVPRVLLIQNKQVAVNLYKKPPGLYDGLPPPKH